METPEGFDPFNSPITVSDASSMLRAKVPRNGKPYAKTVMTLNNRRVDDWEDEVLKEICDPRATLPSGKVWPSWQLYDEGHNVRQMIQLRENRKMFDFPETVIREWKEIFETFSVEELWNLGPGNVAEGWEMVNSYLRLQRALEMYEKIFSLDDDPLIWEKSSILHGPLVRGQKMAFWDPETRKEIAEKVISIVNISIYDEFLVSQKTFSCDYILSEMKIRIPKNTPSYSRIVAEQNNAQLRRWQKTVLSKICDKEISGIRALGSWRLFRDAEHCMKRQELLDSGKILRVPSDILEYWQELFINSPIEELYEMGAGNVGYGWRLVSNELFHLRNDELWEKIVSQTSDPLERQKLLKESSETFGGKELEFWGEEASDIAEKVLAVTNIIVTPDNRYSGRKMF